MTGATQQIIAAVWQDVLKKEDIGMDDNFFDVGGSSLLMIKVHAKLEAALNRNVAVVDLLRYPTVATLAAMLDANSGIRESSHTDVS